MNIDKRIIDTVFKVCLQSGILTEVQTETKKTILYHSFELLYREENGYPVLTLYRDKKMRAKLNISAVPFSQVCEWVQANINIFNN